MNTTEQERWEARQRIRRAMRDARYRLFEKYVVPVEEHPSLCDAAAEQPK